MTVTLSLGKVIKNVKTITVNLNYAKIVFVGEKDARLHEEKVRVTEIEKVEK